MHWMTKWPGDFPVFVAEAHGSRFVDVDGHEYVDFCLGDTGSMTGHGPTATLRAIAEQAARGITLMLPTEDALWVGAELARRFGLPVWQFALDGDRREPVRDPPRAARHRRARRSSSSTGATTAPSTRRSRLCESGVVVARRGNLGPPVPLSETTKVVEWNDVAALEAALAPGDVACVLAEPALTNIGIVHPEPGFHDALRDLTRRTGTLLVIDETHTICCGPGGFTAAHGLEPDALTIGKPIAGGLPAAAYGFTAELAERVASSIELEDADVGGVGGTLAGNALSLAATRATLGEVLTEEAFARMIPLAERWTAGVEEGIAGGRPAVARDASRLPRRVSVRADTTPERHRGGARRRLRARALHAPLRAEPRHPPDAVPQHGAHVARDDRGGRRSAHRGLPRRGARRSPRN